MSQINIVQQYTEIKSKFSFIKWQSKIFWPSPNVFPLQRNSLLSPSWTYILFPFELGIYSTVRKAKIGLPWAQLANVFLPPTNEVWGKVIFSQASVCTPSTVGRGSSWQIPHPTPQDRDPPHDKDPPGQTPETETPRTVKSGRYASYWNAFFF